MHRSDWKCCAEEIVENVSITTGGGGGGGVCGTGAAKLTCCWVSDRP
jgi:hypothetical protein